MITTSDLEGVGRSPVARVGPKGQGPGKNCWGPGKNNLTDNVQKL